MYEHSAKQLLILLSLMLLEIMYSCNYITKCLKDQLEEITSSMIPFTSSFYCCCSTHILTPSLSLAVLGDQAGVDHHLALGKKFLQEGQLSDALHHYSAAIGKDGINFYIHTLSLSLSLATFHLSHTDTNNPLQMVTPLIT